ncbi:hypothetical protein QCA50_019137 [Cerrena zonata]|uniref:Uncharacterized protein n=1 Tax=Cerrena zonata TaxID=2478898 RepID=A0AAW0FFH2_9APHY
MMDTKSRIPQSNIPVKVSRPAQGALPSSLSIPRLGLVPPSRHLSVGDSPTHPAPSSSGSSSGGGITPLRSFRSLLPFGSGSKNPIPNLSPGGSTKSSFATFSAIRKSINGDRSGERSVSAPQLRASKSQEETPVFSIEGPRTIELSYKVNEPLISKEDLPLGIDLYDSPKETSSPKSAPPQARMFQTQTTPSPVPLTLGVSDLSTILESETSGISKHLPQLDDSQYQSTDDGALDLDASYLLPPPDLNGHSQPHSPQDTSALELSMSDVRNQVLEALNGSERPEGWLHGVVVDDMESPNENMLGIEDPDASFGIGSIDSDLAAILSPNRLESKAHTPNTNPSSSPIPSPRSQSRRPSPNPSPVPTVPASPSSLPSPRRRSTSLSRPAAANLQALDTTSRLARSASERPTHIRSPLPSPIAKVSPSRSSDIGERPSLAARRLGNFTLSSERELPRRPHTGTEVDRRPTTSRLTTPAKLIPPGSSSRPLLSRQASSPPSSSRGWDLDSISPSRSPSSTGASTTRLYGRPSLDSGADRLRGIPSRTRDRSASLSESPASEMYRSISSQPSAMDRMGPRTARAFAAAGLIDTDKDASGLSASRSASRFGTSKSDRDFRSQYAPSRLAMSESGSSWERRSGSISRAGAMSEVTSAHYSETLSTPRTTFSAASTAPTSISTNSSPHYPLADMQKMQDMHSLQTQTLMHALADSQLTTRLLREENIQLRDRIHDLENRLADTMNDLQRLQFTSPQSQSHMQTSSSLSRPNNVQRPTGSRGMEFTFRRPSPQRTSPLSLHSNNGDIHVLEASPEIVAPPSTSASARTSIESRRDSDPYHKSMNLRRFSNSSSIFPGPPSTMSMLLHDDGLGSDMHSKSSPSPTLVMSKLPARQPQGSSHPAHHHHRTASSGNISPTTANFSMLTGSPGSLNLRPEHERLLGDMPHLDLGGEDYEPSTFEFSMR